MLFRGCKQHIQTKERGDQNANKWNRYYERVPTRVQNCFMHLAPPQRRHEKFLIFVKEVIGGLLEITYNQA